jgi:hypothetical protein
MNHRLTALRSATLALLALAAGASQATILVFTSQSSFAAAIAGFASGTDTFEDLIVGQVYETPLSRAAGDYGYSVNAGPDSAAVDGAGSATNRWLQADVFSDTLTFSGFTQPTYAAGAFVFGSDAAGRFVRNRRISVTATNSAGDLSRPSTLTRTTQTTFIGFVSDSPLTSVTVRAVQTRGGATAFPTVNDFILASPVPEPKTYALLLAGIGVVGFIARRRRRD